MNYPLPNQSKKYFRSLGQLENSPEFEEFLNREFPQAASEFPEGVSRRRWIQLMGASLALGGAAGCRYNREEFGAFVAPPEGRVYGVPQQFATNFEWAGRVVHAVVSSLEGRPIKVDGNAQHPLYKSAASTEFNDGKDAKFANSGSDVFTQASILSLYDPDRLGAVLHRSSKGSKPASYEENQVASWKEFVKFSVEQNAKLSANQGSGLAIVYEPTRSPSLAKLLSDVKAKYPQATLVEYESVYRRDQAKAIDAAGAGKASLLYNLDAAQVIVAIDDDLLGAHPNAVMHAKQFAKYRTPADDKANDKKMNRLYCIESQYSVTGSSADFRFAMKSSQVSVLVNLIEKLIDEGKAIPAVEGEKTFNELTSQEKFERTAQVIATDLLENKGNSLLTVGAHQPIDVQQAALRINAKLENIGKGLQLLDIASPLNDIEKLRLDDFVLKGSFDTVWILAPNPVFTVPGDIDLAGALAKVPTVVYVADTNDETAQHADWVVPLAHPLESWGDVRGLDGTYGVCQPMIAPVLGGLSLIEIVSILANFEEVDPLKIVQKTAAEFAGGSIDERKWKELLHSGFHADSAAKPISVSISMDKPEPKTVPGAPAVESGKVDLDIDSVTSASIEVVVYPSDTIYDGRLANNGWLQELPQPITKLTWDNAALMSTKTARKLGVKQGELVRLKQGEASVEVPVFIVLGHAEGSITLNLGYGRTHAGSVGGLRKSAKEGFTVGTNLASLRRWNQHSILTGVDVAGTSKPYKLATTQDHFAIDDQGGMREIAKRAPILIREGTLAEFNTDHKFADVHLHHPAESMWKEPDVKVNHAWAMTIDLNKCIGCNACVVACQSENNVPIVGKEQVSRGREMHWLRIDRYFQCDYDVTEKTGDFRDPIDPKVVMQPMACVHCETAPCEQVCPVAATVHTEEGINAMAYNRCIGTRYCANNCPYKVRRFNYFNFNQKYGYFYGWQDWREKVNTKLQSLVLNPEVSVRGRGVMEKCTYCIQRVQNGKIKSRSTGDGKVHDGDIRTACQDACPTQAIVFGDLNDHSSRVYRLQHDPRAYGMLEDLNTKPRTKYLARLRNVPARLMTHDQIHPEWNTSHGHSDEHGEHGHNHDHGDKPEHSKEEEKVQS